MNRPDRRQRRAQGKSDPLELCAAHGDLSRLAARFPWLDAYEGGYRARPGVVCLATPTPEHALQLLRKRGVVEAARKLNLDLMRKGPTMHWRNHCFELADSIFD